MSSDGGFSRRAPSQRQEAVVAAARELFVEHGVQATSIDAIAKRAGVAKGTVYLYFESKHGIVQAIEQEFNARILERVHVAAREADAHDEDAVLAWAGEFARAYLDELETHDLLFYGPVVATREAEVDNVLLGDLQHLLQSRDVATPAEAAAFILGGITLVVDQAIVGRRTDRPEEVAVAVRRLVGTLVSRPAAPPRPD